MSRLVLTARRELVISLHYLSHHSPPVENQTHRHMGRVSFDMKRKAAKHGWYALVQLGQLLEQ